MGYSLELYVVILAGCIILRFSENNVVNNSIIRIIVNIMGILK